jgi:hypothetical protein
LLLKTSVLHLEKIPGEMTTMDARYILAANMSLRNQGKHYSYNLLHLYAIIAVDLLIMETYLMFISMESIQMDTVKKSAEMNLLSLLKRSSQIKGFGN